MLYCVLAHYGYAKIIGKSPVLYENSNLSGKKFEKELQKQLSNYNLDNDENSNTYYDKLFCEYKTFDIKLPANCILFDIEKKEEIAHARYAAYKNKIYKSCLDYDPIPGKR